MQATIKPSLQGLRPAISFMTNLEIIRQLYAAFAARDRVTILNLFHPNIVWIQNDGFPNGGTHTGALTVLDGVFARLGQEWSTWGAHVSEWLDAGGSIIAIGEYQGTHASTRRSMRAAFAHVYRVESGRITRFQQFADTHQVRTAMSPCA